MIARASKHGDTLLFKCIRNIAQFNPNSHETFVRYLETFCIFVQQIKQVENNSDLMLEVLGTMVYIPTDDWEKVIKKTAFLDFIHNVIVHEEVEDDILLECIMLVATICRTEKMAKMISKLRMWSIWTALRPKLAKNTYTCHCLGTEMLQKLYLN